MSCPPNVDWAPTPILGRSNSLSELRDICRLTSLFTSVWSQATEWQRTRKRSQRSISGHEGSNYLSNGLFRGLQRTATDSQRTKLNKFTTGCVRYDRPTKNLYVRSKTKAQSRPIGLPHGTERKLTNEKNRRKPTRWAGQSPTWGRPAPQFRVQNQFK